MIPIEIGSVSSLAPPPHAATVTATAMTIVTSRRIPI